MGGVNSNSEELHTDPIQNLYTKCATDILLIFTLFAQIF